MRTETPWLAAVSPTCKLCGGEGVGPKNKTCPCCFRGIFDQVWNRVRRYDHQNGERISGMRVDGMPRAGRKPSNQNFRAIDFVCSVYLTSKRHLNASDWLLFKLHFVDGIPQNACLRLLHMSEPTFWGRVYLIKQKLGLVFASLTPYPLWPCDEHMSPHPERTTTRPFPALEETRRYRPLRPPLRDPEPSPRVIVEMPRPEKKQLLALDPHDPASLAQYVRTEFARTSLSTLAARLTAMKVPVPECAVSDRMDSTGWTMQKLKKFILASPPEPRTKFHSFARRKAA